MEEMRSIDNTLVRGKQTGFDRGRLTAEIKRWTAGAITGGEDHSDADWLYQPTGTPALSARLPTGNAGLASSDRDI